MARRPYGGRIGFEDFDAQVCYGPDGEAASEGVGAVGADREAPFFAHPRLLDHHGDYALWRVPWIVGDRADGREVRRRAELGLEEPASGHPGNQQSS